MSRWRVEGYAIVSADDRIAGADGAMPDVLRNEADWRRFQAGLDASVLTVLGRLGHEAHANPRGRRRLVVSSQVRALERRQDGWWWNPAGLAWAETVATVAPDGGRIAVPGGQAVFDLFLAIGYDAFHLTRATRATVPGGRGLFSAVDAGRSAEAVLAGAGLRPGPSIDVDAAEGVVLSVWEPL